MVDTLNVLVKSIEKTFIKFSIPRLLFLITIISSAIFAIYIFESYTYYGFHYRMEKKTTLLKQLYEMEEGGIKKYPELHEMYKGVVSELKNSGGKPEFLYDPNIFHNSNIGFKILSALLTPVVILIIGLAKVYKDGAKKLIDGFFFYTIICLSIGLVIPTLNEIWINAIINISFGLLLLLILVILFGRNH